MTIFPTNICCYEGAKDLLDIFMDICGLASIRSTPMPIKNSEQQETYQDTLELRC